MSEWMQSAHERFKALEIPLETLCESYELVRGAVGNQWLEGQERKLAASGRTISDCHPLFRALTSPADTAIVKVCELGVYLKHFMRDPALPTDVQVELQKQLSSMHRAFHFHLYTLKQELERS